MARIFRKKLAYLRSGKNYTWKVYFFGFIVFIIHRYYYILKVVEVSTSKDYKDIFDKTQVSLLKMVVYSYQSHSCKFHGKFPVNENWLQTKKMMIEKFKN